tara:strand:- start:2426 stop:2713 length:288 start_codon:yes stop_codon:yes gene_type:complete
MATSRDDFGFVTMNHKGRLIKTSVGSRQYENTFGGLATFPNTIGSIPIGYVHRPDLISNLWLDSPGLWWMICERNNIFDIFEQLNSADRIYIPTA